MPLHFLYFLFCYYIYLFAFVFSLCHPHHAVVIQRKEVDCPALPKACTCTQDSKGPPGPAGPPVRHTHTHTLVTGQVSPLLHCISSSAYLNETWTTTKRDRTSASQQWHKHHFSCTLSPHFLLTLHVSLIWWRTITKRVTFCTTAKSTMTLIYHLVFKEYAISFLTSRERQWDFFADLSLSIY